VRNLIEQDLAQPGRLSDHEYANAWELQVLDTWLDQVIAPDPGASLPMRCRAARQAESFLQENRDRPVSVCELCLVTSVPKRTLMLGFRDLYSLSPAAYHRRMRLNAARRDLVRTRPGESTVTTTALRWGFGHFGRFSVDYRRMFGESPITTLRR
jgi:transcriptional regulator GlxA family with amidase domain